MKSYSGLLAVAGMAGTVSGHGFITSPKARMPGSAMEAACGQQVYYNQEGDNYGNVQGMLQVAASQTDYNAAACNIWMCKGYKYADNTANVQSYTVGQVVPFTFDIRAPHTGVANISVVRTSDNTVLKSLNSWATFASNSVPIPSTETSFSVTIPDVSSDCSTPGACVLQHYWDANQPNINQTYESCVDFTVGAGSGSGSASAAPASSASSSAAPVKSAAPVSSSVASSSTAALTTQAPASTCACAPQKRDETICETIETKTITSTTVETITNTVLPSSVTNVVNPVSAYGTAGAVGTRNITISVVTVTTTESSTITETTTVPAASSSAGAVGASSITTNIPIPVSATATGFSNATTTCTSNITISAKPTNSANATSLAGAAGTSYSLASLYSSLSTALSGYVPATPITAAPIATGTGIAGAVNASSSVAAAESSASTALASLYSSLTSAIGSINATASTPVTANPIATATLTSNPIANLTSILPSSVVTSVLSGTTLPTAAPSGYGAQPPNLPEGTSLEDLLEWVAYLLGEFEGEREQAETATAAPSFRRRAVRHARNVRRAGMA